MRTLQLIVSQSSYLVMHDAMWGCKSGESFICKLQSEKLGKSTLFHDPHSPLSTTVC